MSRTLRRASLILGLLFVLPWSTALAATTCGGACATVAKCDATAVANPQAKITKTNTDDCTGGQICCTIESEPAPTPEAGQTAAPSAPSGGGAVQLALPPCIKTGNCSLDDIVRTGAAFANLLTELSAALFFATFVYGGARYLLSFGSEKGVSAGKAAIKGGAIGMAIVLGAWTLVNYIANSLTGKS